MVSRLKSNTPLKVEIETWRGDNECTALGGQIAEVFAQAGWDDITIGTFTVSGVPIVDLAVSYSHPPGNNAMQAILGMFDFLNSQTCLITDETLSADTLLIQVLPRKWRAKVATD